MINLLHKKIVFAITFQKYWDFEVNYKNNKTLLNGLITHNFFKINPNTET